MTVAEFVLELSALLAIVGFLGAAIGVLNGRIRQWTFWGIAAGVVIITLLVYPALFGPRD